MKQTISLTSGDVNKSLLRFTVPIMLALFLQTMYGAVDLLIVGQFSQVADVTGVTIGSQNLQLLTSLCTGLAVGTTVLIGRRMGEGDQKAVSQIIANTTLLFTALSLLSMGLLLAFNGQVVALLKTPTEAVNQTAQYLFYCSLGIPLIFAYNVLGSVFRGLGDSRTPLIAVAIACVCNIVLDLVLVAGCSMGAAGAAIATSLSQGISVITCFLMMQKTGLSAAQFKPDLKIIRDIVAIGTPIALQSGLTSVSFVAITVIVNQYDNVAYSASIGVSEKITGFIMLIPLAFMQSLAAYVAQNMGANQMERAKKSLRLSLCYSMVFGAVMAVLTFTHGQLLASCFSSDRAVLDAAGIYLKAYALDTFLVSIMFCQIGYFNGLGKTAFVMIQGILGAVFLRIPLAYLFSLLYPMSLFHIGLGTPISTFIQIIVCSGYYYRLNRTN